PDTGKGTCEERTPGRLAACPSGGAAPGIASQDREAPASVQRYADRHNPGTPNCGRESGEARNRHSRGTSARHPQAGSIRWLTMNGNQADFKYLKEHVSIEHVLSHYGVKLRPAGPGNLRGHCPLPTHTSRVSVASFSVNLSLNVWSCQSASCIAARAGQIGGNVLDLVAAMERCSIREAGIRMAAWFGTQI